MSIQLETEGGNYFRKSWCILSLFDYIYSKTMIWNLILIENHIMTIEKEEEEDYSCASKL